MPSKPTAVPYKELVKKVGTAHYNPRLLKIVSQFKLNEQPGEFVTMHVAGLCKWSKFCEYDGFLDGMFGL